MGTGPSGPGSVESPPLTATEAAYRDVVALRASALTRDVAVTYAASAMKVGFGLIRRESQGSLRDVLIVKTEDLRFFWNLLSRLAGRGWRLVSG